MQEFLHIQFLIQIWPEEVGGEAGVEAMQGATRGWVIPMMHTNTRLGPEHVTNLFKLIVLHITISIQAISNIWGGVDKRTRRNM